MKEGKKLNKVNAMREAVFFYWENGRRRDARLHDPVLEQGDMAAARKVSRKIAKQAGLTDAEIDRLYGEKEKS